MVALNPREFLQSWAELRRDEIEAAGLVHDIVVGPFSAYLDVFGPVVARFVVWREGYGIIFRIDPETGRDVGSDYVDLMTSETMTAWFRSMVAS